MPQQELYRYSFTIQKSTSSTRTNWISAFKKDAFKLKTWKLKHTFTSALMLNSATNKQAVSSEAHMARDLKVHNFVRFDYINDETHLGKRQE